MAVRLALLDYRDYDDTDTDTRQPTGDSVPMPFGLVAFRMRHTSAALLLGKSEVVRSKLVTLYDLDRVKS